MKPSGMSQPPTVINLAMINAVTMLVPK
jgi:hypothetical protein